MVEKYRTDHTNNDLLELSGMENDSILGDTLLPVFDDESFDRKTGNDTDEYLNVVDNSGPVNSVDKNSIQDERIMDTELGQDLEMKENEWEQSSAEQLSSSNDSDMEIDLSDNELDEILSDTDSDFFQDLGEDNDFTNQTDSGSLDLELPEPGDPFGNTDSMELPPLEEETGLDNVDDLHDLTHEEINTTTDDMDEGPVSLSEDELGNILEDVDEGNYQEATGQSPEDLLLGDSLSDDTRYFESGDLSSNDLEIPDDFSLGDYQEEESTEAISGLNEAIEDGNSLDDMSMGGVPPLPDFNNGNSQGDDFVDLNGVSGEEDFPDVTDFDTINSDADYSTALESVEPEIAGSAGGFIDDEDDDDEITLTPEELGNIVSDVSDETEEIAPIEDTETSFYEFNDQELEATADLKNDVPDSFFDLDEEDDEPIALSDEELENILDDVDSDVLPEVSGIDDEIASQGIEVEGTAAEYEHDFQVEPGFTPEREELVSDAASDANLDKTELKKMISYLDGLFDQLPDDTVREFSKSEYFDLYKKIMNELGL